jgi:hypothetical protein
MRVTGQIVVVEHDGIGTKQLCRMRRRPFRLFANLTSPVCVARRRDPEAPQIVGVLLAFNDADRLPAFDRRQDFVDAIQDRGVGTAKFLRPTAFAVWMAELQWLQCQKTRPLASIFTLRHLVRWFALLRFAEHSGQVV